ncbi:MAG: F0F1 ATP synthase subunit epsilon, partial [Actinomycetota bacterium]|nr:F0F1 ATP synthase subunit epsilon [Actinomycetota bacterium]
ISLSIAPIRIVEEAGRERLILVDGGFLHVTPGAEATRVEILAEYAALPEEIDATAARIRADQLRAAAEGQTEVGARADLAKALMRAEHGRA